MIRGNLDLIGSLYSYLAEQWHLWRGSEHLTAAAMILSYCVLIERPGLNPSWSDYRAHNCTTYPRTWLFTSLASIHKWQPSKATYEKDEAEFF